MHQHPFEAPGRPKRSSRAGHKSVVSGLVVRSTMSIIGADRPVPARGTNSCRRCRGQFQIPPPPPETPSRRAHPGTGLVRAGRPVPPIWRGFGLLEMGDSKASDPADLGAYGLLGHGFGLRSSPDPGFSLELSTSERL